MSCAFKLHVHCVAKKVVWNFGDNFAKYIPIFKIILLLNKDKINKKNIFL